MKTRQIIIDNETLDVLPSAVLLTIGAVAVEISDNGLIVLGRWYRRIAWKGRQQERTKTAATQQWWKTHPSISLQAQWEAFGSGHRIPLHLAMHSLQAWLALNPYPIWGNGSDFDNAQLQHAFTQHGLRWPYWRNRCLRSQRGLVLDLYPDTQLPAFPDNKIKHHALHDAEHEAAVLAALLRRMALSQITHVTIDATMPEFMRQMGVTRADLHQIERQNAARRLATIGCDHDEFPLHP